MIKPRFFYLLKRLKVKFRSFLHQHFLVSIAARKLVAKPTLQEEHYDDPVKPNKPKGRAFQK
jgi:hypothetical protein